MTLDELNTLIDRIAQHPYLNQNKYCSHCQKSNVICFINGLCPECYAKETTMSQEDVYENILVALSKGR